MGKWTVWDMIDEFYNKLWKLHEDGALDSKNDNIAIKILNVIDDERETTE